MDHDIRWEQRFANYKKALLQLQRFIDKEELSDLEEQGMIKSFEYTYELAWNVIKDYLIFQGESGIYRSRDAFRIAFNRGLISQGESWMKMVEDRIQTVHTYNEETARKITHVFSSMKQVEQVILYGSRAIGNYREGSDIDISLKGSGLTSNDLDGFLLSLDELNLPYLFDISIFHQINNKDLKEHIQRVGKILYSKQH